jgi:hypothetical protein
VDLDRGGGAEPVRDALSVAAKFGTVEDYVAAIDYVVRIAGEESVGIGCEFPNLTRAMEMAGCRSERSATSWARTGFVCCTRSGASDPNAEPSRRERAWPFRAR